jgi:hypothetical protein
LSKGDKVIFETVPALSGLTEGELYMVETVGEDFVSFRNQLGRGTWDFKAMLERSSFYLATC